MIDKNKLSEKDLENTNGGYTTGQDGGCGFFHVNCGGRILNMLNPFASCCCAKCNETHYFANQFDKYQIYGPLGGWCRVYDDDHIEHCDSKPEELDWPCNK